MATLQMTGVERQERESEAELHARVCRLLFLGPDQTTCSKSDLSVITKRGTQTRCSDVAQDDWIPPIAVQTHKVSCRNGCAHTHQRIGMGEEEREGGRGRDHHRSMGGGSEARRQQWMTIVSYHNGPASAVEE